VEKMSQYKNLPEYFTVALKGILGNSARGTKSKVARSAGVSSAMITDILMGRKFGSEAVRWAIVEALGWGYEEFLKYGQCLEEGLEYRRPEPPRPAPESGEYVSVQFAEGVRRTINGRETAYTAVVANDKPPLLLPRHRLVESRLWGDLAAFSVKAHNMEPGLPYGCTVVVDLSVREPMDNRIYLLADAEDYQINRIRERERRLYAVSDNPAVPPELLEPSNVGLVIGQVLFSWHVHI